MELASFGLPSCTSNLVREVSGFGKTCFEGARHPSQLTYPVRKR
jgi:hypothetical protein